MTGAVVAAGSQKFVQVGANDAAMATGSPSTANWGNVVFQPSTNTGGSSVVDSPGITSLTGFKIRTTGGTTSDVALMVVRASDMVVLSISASFNVGANVLTDCTLVTPQTYNPATDCIGVWSNNQFMGQGILTASGGPSFQYIPNASTAKPLVGTDLDLGGYITDTRTAGSYVPLLQAYGFA